MVEIALKESPDPIMEKSTCQFFLAAINESILVSIEPKRLMLFGGTGKQHFYSV